MLRKPPHTITIEFGEDGEPVISVKGLNGAACKDATKGIEEALGVVSKRTPTAEMTQVQGAMSNNAATVRNSR